MVSSSNGRSAPPGKSQVASSSSRPLGKGRPLPAATDIARATGEASHIASILLQRAFAGVDAGPVATLPHSSSSSGPEIPGYPHGRSRRNRPVAAGAEQDAESSSQPANAEEAATSLGKPSKGRKRGGGIASSATPAPAKAKRRRLDPVADPSIDIYTSISERVKGKVRRGRGNAAALIPGPDVRGESEVAEVPTLPLPLVPLLPEPLIQAAVSGEATSSVDNAALAPLVQSPPAEDHPPQTQSTAYRPAPLGDADSEMDEAEVESLIPEVDDDATWEHIIEVDPEVQPAVAQASPQTSSSTKASAYPRRTSQPRAAVNEELINQGLVQAIRKEVEALSRSPPTSRTYPLHSMSAGSSLHAEVTPGEMEEAMIGFSEQDGDESSDVDSSDGEEDADAVRREQTASPPLQASPVPHVDASPVLQVKIEDSDSDVGELDQDALGQAFLEYLPTVVRPRFLGRPSHGISSNEMTQIGQEIRHRQARERTKRKRTIVGG